jgi:hypothetical protein
VKERLLLKRSPESERDEAARKAIDSLARYKFMMFGYWAAVWVHMNRLAATKTASPFQDIVRAARNIREKAVRS